MLSGFASAGTVRACRLTDIAFRVNSVHWSVRKALRYSFCARVFAVLIVFAVAGGGSGPMLAAEPSIEFNIPSQTLRTALIRYGDATGRDAVYDTDAAKDLVSGEVRGRLAPDEALKQLLFGTGLTAQFVTERTFALLPVPANRQALRQTRSPEHRRYYGLIQAGLADALCQSGSARPDEYRFAAAMWIAADGTVRRSERIGTTGRFEIDDQIDGALRNVRIDEAPPMGFQQPVLILIVPNGPGVTRACGEMAPGLRKLGLAP